MKKMTSLLLAVVMVFALAVPAFAAVYPDQAGGNSLADMINARKPQRSTAIRA